MEAAERQRIEDLKESERKKATEELENWKEEQKRLAEEVNTQQGRQLHCLIMLVQF